MAIFDNLGGYDIAASIASGDLREEIDLKADIDGYYAQLTAGAADNLTARGDAVEASFIRRTSGGIADIESGHATIESIKGNTVRWNQRIDVTTDAIAGNMGTKTFDSSTGIWSIACTKASTSAFGFYTIPSATRGVVGGHKSLVRAKVRLSTAADVRFGVASNYTTFAVGTDFTLIATVITPNTTVAASCYTNGGDGLTMQVKEIEVFDLTVMFGAGSEPSTVAEFEALYGDPYYAYDAGSLKPVKLNGIETTGFNQWDADHLTLENKTVEGASNTSTVSCAEYIDAFPNMQYEMYADVTGISQYAYQYDADKNVIGSTPASTSTKSLIFTTESNTRYVRFQWWKSGGLSVDAIKAANPCLHLVWSGRRNGEYEAFWKSQRAIDVATYFPDGMRSAGSVYDELTSTEAITRVGAVDLGTLTWTADTDSTGQYFYGTLSGAQKAPSSSVAGNIRCALYETVPSNNVQDKNIAISGNNTTLYVRDTAYTDPAAFKTAMSGVMLHYALATPTTTPIDPSLNMTYRTEQGGTERVMVPTGELSAPPTLVTAQGYTAESLRDAALSAIAPVENGLASTNYAVGSYLIHDGQLCKVTTAIATGESITIGTNVTATTVMAEILSLVQ